MAGAWVIIPDEGAADTLAELLLPAQPRNDWWLLLLVADPAETPTLTLDNLVEASFAGYLRKLLGRTAWQTPTTVAGCTSSQWGTDPWTWTSSGPAQTIYGVAYLDAVSRLLKKVFRFDDADVVTLDPGSTYTLTPVVTLTSALC